MLGAGKPAVVDDNKAFKLDDASRPSPEVPSIYQWQKKSFGISN
jgi:hypothetical protein